MYSPVIGKSIRTTECCCAVCRLDNAAKTPVNTVCSPEAPAARIFGDVEYPREGIALEGVGLVFLRRIARSIKPIMTFLIQQIADDDIDAFSGTYLWE